MSKINEDAKPGAPCAGLFCLQWYTQFMTLILELTPAEEARLAAAARLNRTEPALLVKQLVAECLPLLDYKNGVFLDAQERERIAGILAAEGSFADDSWDAVAELHRDRQIDKAKEEAWAKEYMT